MKRALFCLLFAAVAFIAVQGTAEAQGSLLTKSCNFVSSSSTTTGTDCDVSQMSTLVIQVSSSASSFTLKFLGSVSGGSSPTMTPITCYPQGSSTGATNITSTGTNDNVAAIQVCNVAGLLKVRTQLSAVSGGTVTVIGSAFSSPRATGGVLY
jgi:hypothetical protein